MSETSVDASAVQWWPGCASTILSVILTALAVPFLFFAAWAFILGVSSGPCHRIAHAGQSDCEDAGIAKGLALEVGTALTGIGGVLMIGAARLFLRPGLRGRVIWFIVILTVAYPFGILVLR